VVVEGLAGLIGEFGFQASTSHRLPESAQAALWAPNRLSLPIPSARPIPTLVVVDAEPQDLVALLTHGYRGFLRADADRRQLRAALEAVAGGAIWAPRELMAQALSTFVTVHGASPMPTRREIDVLSLLGRGMTNRAIAQRLGIAERTVKSHVSNLLAKYRVKSRVELVVSVLDRLRDQTE
jgi:DNA-binding NarL/FixJ family response regulator